jgi:hypothetical protein
MKKKTIGGQTGYLIGLFFILAIAMIKKIHTLFDAFKY